ncbi:MAG TPA: efflux RND transporter permease subunit [Mizugakiibacter sp.]
MNISGPFIRRPIGTSLLAAGMAVAGLIAYFLLAVAPLPNLEFPAIFVHANQPGADARTMASTVAAPLERHLGQIAGIDTMNSENTEGSTFVFMIFDVGHNLDSAARDVQAAINAAAPDLPSGLRTAPTYRKADPNRAPILSLALTSKSVPLSQMYNLADSLLAQRILQQPGVADVDIRGGATPAVRVDLNLRALSAMGLSGDDVRNALSAANVTSPQGFLSDGRTMMAVSANDALRTADDFARLVIGVRNGTPVRLQDVAHVYDGQEDRYQAAWFNGQRAILLMVRKQADANILQTVRSIRDQLPLMRSWLPAGVQLTPFFDRTGTIEASVDEVQVTLLISLGLVVFTMLLFLRRLTPTLIAGLAVPLSLAGALAAMYALGFTLDNLSLMALVIAVGFVVDDAIVVIENIVRHLDEGLSPLQAALQGAREIGFTVVSITVSLIAVFIPMIFAPGLLGLLFREFSVTLAAAVAISAVVSLTVTPSLCARFLRPHDDKPPSKLGARIDAFHARMHSGYARLLDWALRHRRLMALQPLLLVVLTIVLFITVPKGFFPQQDTGMLRGHTESGADVSYTVMAARQQQIAAIVQRDPAVDSVGSFLSGGRWGGANTGSLFITLKPFGDGRKDHAEAVLARLRAATANVPGIRMSLSPVQDIGGGGGGGSSDKAQYQYALKGDDLDALRSWAPRVAAALRALPQFKDVSTDYDSAGMQQNLVIDRGAAARLGVSIAAIDSALYDAFGQRQISTIYSDLNQYKVVLDALPGMAQTPQSLLNLYVRSNRGTMVPLSAVTRMEPAVAPLEVDHEGQFPVANVYFNLAPGVSMGSAVPLIDRTLRDLRVPGSIRGEFGGDFRRFQQSQSGGPWLILAAILTVYIVLGMLYENLVHPVTILSTLPSAGVGALLALQITGTELSLVSVIAIVLLIGIVKKNAIMVVDFALTAERERGLSPEAAIREACLVRFRPIMMTSMVTFLSAVPLAIGFGVGAEMRQPLGVAMAGGLLVSQSLTLLSTPAIYLVFSRLAARWRERRRARRATPAPAA